MSDPGLAALTAIPELIAAIVLTIISIRAARPRGTVLIALAIGVSAGCALTILVERVIER